MPVPEALRRLSQDPGFWSGPLTDDGSAPTDVLDEHPDELRVTLPVAGGYGLVLDLDLVAGERTLGLRGPASSEPVHLGRVVPGLPYPAVLGFAELEVCARVIALDDPDLPHPGLVVALLAGFAPAGPGDDAAEVAAVLGAAYRSLRRDVAPVAAAHGPEQAPLPLFTDAAWWPRPAQPSARVLDEGAITTFLTAALRTAPSGPHAGRAARFPTEDLTELVRRARRRLARLPHEPWFDTALVRPLARQIADTGDLGPVTDLLDTLTETGCDHPTVLDALSEPVVPVEACWMVETLVGAEPGTLLRRVVGAARLG